MKAPLTNPRPTYYAAPAFYDEAHPDGGKRRQNCFNIYEVRGSNHSLLFTISNRGDRMHNLLARGIPTEDAKAVFYQMDE